jgi:hypothetical protein
MLVNKLMMTCSQIGIRPRFTGVGRNAAGNICPHYDVSFRWVNQMQDSAWDRALLGCAAEPRRTLPRGLAFVNGIPKLRNRLFLGGIGVALPGGRV